MKQLTNYKSDDIMILFKLTERELCRANGMSDGLYASPETVGALRTAFAAAQLSSLYHNTAAIARASQYNSGVYAHTARGAADVPAVNADFREKTKRSILK